MKNHAYIIRLTFTALFAAIIMLATMAIAIPVGGGAYINAGDAIIYTASWFLGPWAAVSAGLGSALADLMVPGAAIYAPATLIIKGLMGLVVGLLMKRYKDNIWPKIIAMSVGAAIMVLGYFAYEFFGAKLLDITRLGAVANIPFNLIQAVGGVIIGALVISALGKIKGINSFMDKLKGN